MALKKKKPGGISLRMIQICMIIGAVVFSGLVLFFTYQLSARSRELTEISEQQIELRKAALELMDASDYLTENVQRFAVQGDPKFMEAYFNEAFEAQHREDAISRMSVDYGSAEALAKLKDAMTNSVALMDREYYAMRLVIEAKGYTDYPQKLRSVELSEADAALSADDKMTRAAEMVFDDEYYTQKNRIRINMSASLEELEQLAYTEDDSVLQTLRYELIFVRVVIVLQTVGAIGMVLLTSRLGIHPILNAVERIKSDSLIPEVGANEFRYLARTYNKMYAVYKSSLEHLNFKASHDELTGLYNRAGYELLLSSLDLSNTYMLLFDVDNFKTINDSYGHETGDRILTKFAEILKHHFRCDDYICRIGGDEFVVFMVHSGKDVHDMLAAKIEKINKDLEDTSDGLPAVSISVGITDGSEVSEVDKLFEKTDEAMYRAKRKGKHTYAFTK